MTRITGVLIATAGLVAWAAAVALRPALTAAGLAVGGGAVPLPQQFNAETHLVLLLDAHDLRLAALVVVMAGVALIVAGTSRPGPVLLATGVTMLVANLVWGLASGPLAVVAGTTALLLLVAGTTAHRRSPPDPGARPQGRALPAVAALFAAGTGLGLTLQASLHPRLAPHVPPAYLDLLLTVRVLLVVTAVVAACCAGRRRWRGRAAAGVLVVAGVGGSMVAGYGERLWPDGDGWAGPVAAVLGVAVLALIWSGRAAAPRTRLLQLGGAVVAAAAPTYGAVLLGGLGLFVSVLSLLLGATEMGADGVPTAGVGLVYGAVLVAVHAGVSHLARRPVVTSRGPAGVRSGAPTRP